jgi:hypothetical protein
LAGERADWLWNSMPTRLSKPLIGIDWDWTWTWFWRRLACWRDPIKWLPWSKAAWRRMSLFGSSTPCVDNDGADKDRDRDGR